MKNAAKTTILLTLTMLLLALGACYHPPKFRVAVIDNFYPERTTFSSTESRNLFTLGYGRDIDGDDKADCVDPDDDMVDDSDSSGPGAGKPDWWEKKHPGK